MIEILEQAYDALAEFGVMLSTFLVMCGIASTVVFRIVTTSWYQRLDYIGDEMNMLGDYAVGVPFSYDAGRERRLAHHLIHSWNPWKTIGYSDQRPHFFNVVRRQGPWQHLLDWGFIAMLALNLPLNIVLFGIIYLYSEHTYRKKRIDDAINALRS